jgi:hypothetical protein
MPSDWLTIVTDVGLRPTQPADGPAIRAAEEALGHRLSVALRDLYRQSNGIFDEWGYAYVLRVEELPGRQRELREPWAATYEPFDGLCVVGQLGNGDLLMHPVDRQRLTEAVVVWDHEDDSRTVYASDLAEALTRLAGSSGSER